MHELIVAININTLKLPTTKYKCIIKVNVVRGTIVNRVTVLANKDFY